MLSTWEVLALPARRTIIDYLKYGPCTVGSLTDSLGMSQPVVSKHLKVLRDSGFVSVRADGQLRWYTLQPEPFVELAAFLETYREFWDHHLDKLSVHLDTLAAKDSNP